MCCSLGFKPSQFLTTIARFQEVQEQEEVMTTALVGGITIERLRFVSNMRFVKYAAFWDGHGCKSQLKSVSNMIAMGPSSLTLECSGFKHRFACLCYVYFLLANYNLRAP